jgi:hypothetical protein
MGARPPEADDIERATRINAEWAKLSPWERERELSRVDSERLAALKADKSLHIAMLPDGTTISGTPWEIYQAQSRVGYIVGWEHSLRTGSNIAGGLAGTVGYALDGERGAEAGARLIDDPLNAAAVLPGSSHESRAEYVHGAPTYQRLVDPYRRFADPAKERFVEPPTSQPSESKPPTSQPPMWKPPTWKLPESKSPYGPVYPSARDRGLPESTVPVQSLEPPRTASRSTPPISKPPASKPPLLRIETSPRDRGLPERTVPVNSIELPGAVSPTVPAYQLAPKAAPAKIAASGAGAPRAAAKSAAGKSAGGKKAPTEAATVAPDVHDALEKKATRLGAPPAAVPGSTELSSTPDEPNKDSPSAQRSVDDAARGLRPPAKPRLGLHLKPISDSEQHAKESYIILERQAAQEIRDYAERIGRPAPIQNRTFRKIAEDLAEHARQSEGWPVPADIGATIGNGLRLSRRALLEQLNLGDVVRVLERWYQDRAAASRAALRDTLSRGMGWESAKRRTRDLVSDLESWEPHEGQREDMEPSGDDVPRPPGLTAEEQTAYDRMAEDSRLQRELAEMLKARVDRSKPDNLLFEKDLSESMIIDATERVEDPMHQLKLIADREAATRVIEELTRYSEPRVASPRDAPERHLASEVGPKAGTNQLPTSSVTNRARIVRFLRGKLSRVNVLQGVKPDLVRAANDLDTDGN